MRIYTFLFLLAISFRSYAQPCLFMTQPGRVPQTAIAVCGALTFQQPQVPSCTANDLSTPECSDNAMTSNSVWYKFHCYQSGTLNFMISPSSFNDDYDWHLHDYTGHPPQDVLTQNLRISLNLSATTPNTGCSNAGTGNVNCAGNSDPFNQSPNLVAGHDYLLCVTNWTNSQVGYDLDLTGGTAVLTDNLPPTITSVGIVGCNTSLIKIIFSEDILCSSLTANGSEFNISNGTHVITGLVSSCNTTNAFTELTLSLQAPLTAGNYNLVVNDGSDLNTLLDVCETVIPAGASFPFTVPAQVPLAINNISFTGCAPNILKVALSKPVLCSSITATGSEFTLSPGSHLISSVSSTCGGATTYTDTIQLVLQDRLPYGNYQLNVNAGSDGNTLIDTCGTALVGGYQFLFVINQTTTAPAVQSVVFDECKPYLLVVNFDKPVACNSLTALGSEFSVTPGSHPVTSIVSNCNAGYTTQVRIVLANNLPAGNFNLAINNGTDANTLSDSCFSFIPVNTVTAFTTTQAPAPTYDSVQYDKCSPFEIKIFYSKPINCGSVFVPGIEFSITGPAPVSILSVSGDPATCSTSFSPWLILHLSAPINTFGTYTLHNINGPDGNSVMDTCFAVQDNAETISFNVLGKPSAAFTDEIRWGCEMDTIEVSHPGGNGINSWTWNFSDNTSATGPSVTHTFPVTTTTATVQLIVSNGICNDTLLKSYTLGNAFTVDFTMSADTVCINSGLTLTNISHGENLEYLWQFGDNTQSTDLNPVPHTYSTDNSYDIDLIVTNDHGCKDTTTKTVVVTKEPVVDFTGLNAQYCTGDVVTLVSDIQGGNTSSYTWNNGNGTIISNQPTISYTYNAQDLYSISLSATDRFCAVSVKDSSTQVYQVPVLDLGIDKTLCPGLSIRIGTATLSGYTYLWSTGAVSSEIMTAIQTGTYKLTINNNGCISEDEILVKVLDNCLIKVPGAFTPNRDGLNDRLKAINADLATNFSLKVYNRFGQLLFSTTNPLDGWDGTYKGMPQETATYVWQVSYIDPTNHKPVYEKGTSILIR